MVVDRGGGLPGQLVVARRFTLAGVPFSRHPRPKTGSIVGFLGEAVGSSVEEKR